MRAGAPRNARVASWQLAFSRAVPLANVVPAVLNVHALLDGTALQRIGRVLTSVGLGWAAALLGALLALAIGALARLEAAGVVRVRLTSARAFTARWDAALTPAWSGYLELCAGLFCVPFWSVRLPHFVLPPPLASLDALLSSAPFGERTRLLRSAVPSRALARAAHTLLSSARAEVRLRGRAPAVQLRLTLPDLTEVRLDLRAHGGGGGAAAELSLIHI